MNGKSYIGSTHRTFLIRWKEWGWDLRRGVGSKHLQSAWDMYGAKNFEFTVREIVSDVAIVLAQEQHYLDTEYHEYNLKDTADTTSRGVIQGAQARESHRRARIGKKLSPETKKKIGDASRGKPRSPETKRKISEAHTGKTASPEAREAMRAAHVGVAQSPESVAKRSAAIVGKPRSEETRKKISQSHVGVKASQEARDKMRLANLGKTQSAETKAKRAATWAAKRLARADH